ncbi:MAG: flagellar basal body-associated FliL family protein [Firmicutes bacterium]|nr:flagellar basal body-associated FliL family protein [Bacillota bacterium]
MEEKKKKSKLKIIIPLIIAIILAAVTGYLYIATDTFKDIELFKEKDTSFNYEVGQIVVNLKNDRINRYLKTKIVLSYKNKEDIEILEKRKFQIKDIIIRILRSKEIDDIKTVEKTDSLKKEILEKVNVIFDKNVINDVYITDFMVQ